jgi:hypothetical protein
MNEVPQPIHVPLTPDQQALIKRLSGQHAEILELTPEAENPAGGTGQTLRFRWRLSLTTGIPRQEWTGTGRGP